MRKSVVHVVCILFGLLLLPPNLFADEVLHFDRLDKIGGPVYSGVDSGQKLTARQVYKKVDPAVVTVVHKLNGKYVGHGSGFIVKSNGFIITNHHVVDVGNMAKHGQHVMEVMMADGSYKSCKIIKSDPQLDLALIKIKGSGLPVVDMADSSSVAVGDDVYVIGTPTRLEFEHSMTEGIVSGLGRDHGRIQSSVTIHGGNSGGPAFNDHGQVIGVAVAVAVSSERRLIEAGGEVAEVNMLEVKHGISYLVPASYATNLLNLMY